MGTGARAIRSIGHLLSNADVVAAHTVRALDANTSVFDDDLVRARPLLGQISSAARLREALAGVAGDGSVRSVQDPISVRTVPQVHGVAIDQLEHVAAMLEVEVNSRSENPLVRLEDRRVISNGNFSLLGVAVGFEGLRLSLAHVGMLVERRIALLARTLRAHAPVVDHIRAQLQRSDYLAPVLLASDLVVPREHDAAPGLSDTGQLLATVLSQLPTGATTDLVVERLRAHLVDTCLVTDCLADQVVAADRGRGGVLSMHRAAPGSQTRERAHG